MLLGPKYAILCLVVGQSGRKWDAGVGRRSVFNEWVEHMFLGQYRHTIDNKGRLIVPARFRDFLSEGGFITQGFDRNLMVLTSQAFDSITQRVNQLSSTDETARQLRRLIYATADRVELDKTGRIRIPQFLQDVAGFNSDAVVVGVGAYFEIWAPDAWDSQESLLQDPEANAHRFAALDLTTGP